MRARVAAFLRVLNRAKQEKPETERKTFTYVLILLPDDLSPNSSAGDGRLFSDEFSRRAAKSRMVCYHSS